MQDTNQLRLLYKAYEMTLLPKSLQSFVRPLVLPRLRFSSVFCSFKFWAWCVPECDMCPDSNSFIKPSTASLSHRASNQYIGQAHYAMYIHFEFDQLILLLGVCTQKTASSTCAGERWARNRWHVALHCMETECVQHTATGFGVF